MATLPALTWIRNAAAVLFGGHGAVTAQARQAGWVRAAWHEAARPLVREQALDESHVRGRPILVGVEPAGLALGLARRVADCTGPTWAQALAPFPALEYAICDGGGGLRAGL